MSSCHSNSETDNDSSYPLIEWKEEAAAIIRDVQKHVQDIQISTKLLSNNAEIFLNVTTLENKTYCIRISAEGFQIVGQSYDMVEMIENSTQTYETPYALLNDISAGYVQSFGNDLAAALERLNQNNSED